MKANFTQHYTPFVYGVDPLPEKNLVSDSRAVLPSCATGTLIDQPDPVLQKVRSWIENNLTEDIRIEDLPRVLFYSRAQIFRKIKSLTGQSPSRFICRIRLEKAMELLQSSDRKIADIATTVGFADVKYFFRVFRREFGAPPSAIRRITYK